MNDMIELFNLMNLAIPEGIDEEMEVEGKKIHFQKKDGTVKIEVESIPEKFDDSETKELVDMYKNHIEELDDDVFVEISEELSKKINLKEFDELLKLEHFTKEQADKVEEMITIASEIACLHLQHRIQNLVELYERF